MYRKRFKSSLLQLIVQVVICVIALNILIGELMQPAHAQQINGITAFDQSKLPNEVTWSLTYSGPPPDLSEIQMEGDGEFILKTVAKPSGIQIAIYLDLWQTCDVDLDLPFTDERFRSIINPLVQMIYDPSFRDRWNAETDSIAVFATKIDVDNDFQNSDTQSLETLIKWEHDLNEFGNLINKLKLDDIPAYYNHARLSDRLGRDFFTGNVFADSDDIAKHIVLISDGHDYGLHNILDSNGAFLSVDADSQEAEKREDEAIEYIFAQAIKHSTTIQPVYVLPNTEYHGRRFLEKIAQRFSAMSVIDLEPNSQVNNDFQSSIMNASTRMLSTVTRQQTVTFSAKQFDQLPQSVWLVDRDGNLLVADGTKQFNLEEIIEPVGIEWRVSTSNSLTPTVKIEAVVNGWLAQFPSLETQSIQFEVIPVDGGERKFISTSDLQFEKSNRIVYESSNLPSGSYAVNLISSTSLLQPTALGSFSVDAQRPYPTLWERLLTWIDDFFRPIYDAASLERSDRSGIQIIRMLLLAGLLLMLANLIWGIAWLWKKLRSAGQKSTTISQPENGQSAQIGSGARLNELEDHQNKQFVGRLLRIYGDNAVPLIELSKERMYFGSKAMPQIQGRFIWPCPSTEINDLQFHILPYQNRLCIFDEDNEPDSEDDPLGSHRDNLSTQYHRTLLNDEPVVKFNSTSNENARQYLSSGDIISIGQNVKYRVSLKEQDAGGLRLARSQNGRQWPRSTQPFQRAPGATHTGINMAENAPADWQPERAPVSAAISEEPIAQRQTQTVPKTQSVPTGSRIVHGATSPDLVQKLNSTLAKSTKNREDNIFRRIWKRSLAGNRQKVIGVESGQGGAHGNPIQSIETSDSEFVAASTMTQEKTPMMDTVLSTVIDEPAFRRPIETQTTGAVPMLQNELANPQTSSPLNTPLPELQAGSGHSNQKIDVGPSESEAAHSLRPVSNSSEQNLNKQETPSPLRSSIRQERIVSSAENQPPKIAIVSKEPQPLTQAGSAHDKANQDAKPPSSSRSSATDKQSKNPTTPETLLGKNQSAQSERAEQSPILQRGSFAQSPELQTSDPTGPQVVGQQKLSQSVKENQERSITTIPTERKSSTIDSPNTQHHVDNITQAEANVVNTLRHKDDETTIFQLIPAFDDSNDDDVDSDTPNIDSSKSRSTKRKRT